MKKYLPALLLLFVAGCQSAPVPANAPTPTVTDSILVDVPTPESIPTQTSTPQPPLKEHEWLPKTILLRFDLTNEKNAVLNPPPPPQFILYADGKLLLTRPAIEGYPHGDQQLLVKQLERGEMCRILNTLDQSGFLDYNPASYQFSGGKPNMDNGVSAYIEVNAWKSHKQEYQELPFYLFDELTGILENRADEKSGFPVISPALRNAYYLLADYPLDGFDIYEPENLVVWIRPLNPAEYPNVQWQNWGFSALTISYMNSKINHNGKNFDEQYLILRKQGATNLSEYLSASFSTQYYVETGKQGEKSYYAVYARPLLPYELPGTDEMDTSAPASPNIKCSPSDGVMEIPQPNLIYNLPIP